MASSSEYELIMQQVKEDEIKEAERDKKFASDIFNIKLAAEKVYYHFNSISISISNRRKMTILPRQKSRLMKTKKWEHKILEEKAWLLKCNRCPMPSLKSWKLILSGYIISINCAVEHHIAPSLFHFFSTIRAAEDRKSAQSSIKADAEGSVSSFLFKCTYWFVYFNFSYFYLIF